MKEEQPGVSALAALLLIAAGAFMALLYRATLRFCADVKPFKVVRTGVVEREIRPPSDGMHHVMLFQWQLFGTGWLFQRALRRLNSKYAHWDSPFAERGQDAETEVLNFCNTYGVQQEPWVWSKPAKEYSTMNEWFTRKYSPSLAPENNLGSSDVLSPATAVVFSFPSVLQMPDLVKNEKFTISETGIPEHTVSLVLVHGILHARRS